MSAILLGQKTEYLPGRVAQALLDADKACAEAGLLFELKCAQCGRAWGSDETRVSGDRVVYYAIKCDCKTRVYDAKVV